MDEHKLKFNAFVKQAGLAQGYVQAFDRAFERGFKQGYEEGLQQAWQETIASLATRLLKRRLGSLNTNSLERVQHLRIEQLEALCVELVDFKSTADLDQWFCEALPSIESGNQHDP